MLSLLALGTFSVITVCVKKPSVTQQLYLLHAILVTEPKHYSWRQAWDYGNVWSTAMVEAIWQYLGDVIHDGMEKFTLG